MPAAVSLQFHPHNFARRDRPWPIRIRPPLRWVGGWRLLSWASKTRRLCRLALLRVDGCIPSKFPLDGADMRGCRRVCFRARFVLGLDFRGPFVAPGAGATLDRCGVFVDAGYLSGGWTTLHWDKASGKPPSGARRAAITALLEYARGHGGHEALRMYWYDAAPNAVALPEHQANSCCPRTLRFVWAPRRAEGSPPAEGCGFARRSGLDRPGQRKGDLHRLSPCGGPRAPGKALLRPRSRDYRSCSRHSNSRWSIESGSVVDPRSRRACRPEKQQRSGTPISARRVPR